MNKKIKDVKILLWDVDGTLASSDKLMPAIHNAQKRVIASALDVDIEEATELWLEQRKNFSSTTQLTAFLIKKDPVETGILIEQISQKWKVTPKDPKLVAMFGRLTKFTHYICGNGTRDGITKQLHAIGLDPNIFKKIIGIDVVGFPKPNLSMFQYVLSETKLPVAQHVMIGDRIDVDILPAHALGIQTCLIGPASDQADVSVPTIYDVEKMLIA